MQKNRFLSPMALAMLALIPGQAFAHGEEALLVPVGALTAVAIVVLFASLFKLSGGLRVVAGLLAASAVVPVGLIPSNYFPSALRYTLSGNFLFGLLPSLVIGGLVVWLALRFGDS